MTTPAPRTLCASDRTRASRALFVHSQLTQYLVLSDEHDRIECRILGNLATYIIVLHIYMELLLHFAVWRDNNYLLRRDFMSISPRNMPDAAMLIGGSSQNYITEGIACEYICVQMESENTK